MSIRVLIVDDSALVRQVLRALIEDHAGLEVVGCAPDPFVAREMIKQYRPDVLTLDVEMPRMDGLAFLEKLMRLHPLPVVMVSSLTERGSEVTFRALELGAVDFIAKPKLNIAQELAAYAEDIAHKLRAAARARIRPRGEPVIPAPALRAPLPGSERIICIGASTGGTEALKEVLLALPADAPGVLVTQHMPPGFTRSFAERLDRLCALRVVEARGNERVLPGHVFIAPGDAHLQLKRCGANYKTALSDAPPLNRHRPAVDLLFESAATCAGKNAIGVILTGMGRDGARGLLAMRRAGAFTIAQDEASCVVYGMPREAVALDAACEQWPLRDIAGRLVARLRERGVAAPRV